MNEQLFFVYAIKKSNGDLVGEKRVCKFDNRQKVADSLYSDYGCSEIVVHINKASYCFDGYLVQGDHLGSINPSYLTD